MPSIIPVTVKDRVATPVVHTFAPTDVTQGEGTLVERLASGSYIGEPKLIASNRTTPNKRTKAVMKLSVPKVVVETVNGVEVPRVVGTSHITVTHDWDQMHTATERNNIQGMVADALGPVSAQPFLNPVLLGKEAVYS